MFTRQAVTPRYNWQKIVEEQGMFYHTIDGKEYWNESACYVLNSKLVDKIEDATNELHQMCLEFVAEEISKGDYEGYNFSDLAKDLIEKSWNNDHPYTYGRFDLGIDALGNLKMFEYNADTPTSLLEAAVIQWNWKEEIHPEADQFNSIHEALIQNWGADKQKLGKTYFTALTRGPHEDWGNLHYLMETASLAGLQTSSINLETIGWNGTDFVDLNGESIHSLFKLYPWEWLMNDEFSANIPNSKTLFIEPAWKMLLSNKLLLVKLWERHKNHPLLLEAHDYSENNFSRPNNVLLKPKLGREGHGVMELTGQPWLPGNIIQEKFNVVEFNGIQPVIGSWVVGNKACGIGIREDKGITTNNSQFVPHYFI